MRVLRATAARNLAALAVGCAIAVLSVGLAELVVRVVAPRPPPMEEQSSPPYMEPDETLGWRPAASLQTHTRKLRGTQVVYDATYTFDEYRRRIVPGEPHAQHHRFLLFFGCSNTFGEGLQDDESLPAVVSRSLPDTQVYNYAFRGYGPQHMLARLETSNLRGEVAEPAGTVVYVFPAYHLDRLIGGSATMSWVGNLPYYRLEQGDPIRDGLFQTTRPLYSFFARAVGTSRLLQALNVAWPPRPRAADLALTCAVFAKAKRLLQAQLGPTPLVVMLYPGRPLDLASCLEPLGIPVLDHHAIFPEASRDEMRIPDDGHTNARGNRALAAQLVDDLGRMPGRR